MHLHDTRGGSVRYKIDILHICSLFVQFILHEYCELFQTQGVLFEIISKKSTTEVGLLGPDPLPRTRPDFQSLQPSVLDISLAKVEHVGIYCPSSTL